MVKKGTVAKMCIVFVLISPAYGVARSPGPGGGLLLSDANFSPVLPLPPKSLK